jgi:hypothetical protein
MRAGDPPLSGLFAQALAPKPVRKRKGSPVFPLRLSADERARLEELAGETPLATYIKFRIFNNLPPLAQLQGVRNGCDTKLIAQLLAVLGEARIANNLNQLARHANMGTLEVTPETELQLLEACADVQIMRRALMTALGSKSEAPP